MEEQIINKINEAKQNLLKQIFNSDEKIANEFLINKDDIAKVFSEVNPLDEKLHKTIITKIAKLHKDIDLKKLTKMYLPNILEVLIDQFDDAKYYSTKGVFSSLDILYCAPSIDKFMKIFNYFDENCRSCIELHDAVPNHSHYAPNRLILSGKIRLFTTEEYHYITDKLPQHFNGKYYYRHFCNYVTFFRNNRISEYRLHTYIVYNEYSGEYLIEWDNRMPY